MPKPSNRFLAVCPKCGNQKIIIAPREAMDKPITYYCTECNTFLPESQLGWIT